MSKFSKFVKSIVNNFELEHPDEDTFRKVQEEGKNHGLSPEQSWQAYLVASDYRSLFDQEIIDGGNGSFSNKINPETLKEINFGEKKK